MLRKITRIIHSSDLYSQSTISAKSEFASRQTSLQYEYSSIEPNNLAQLQLPSSLRDLSVAASFVSLSIMASSKATHSCVSCYTYDRSSKGTLVTPCCARFVCGPCARSNPRLAETCILCQLPIPHDLAPATAEDLPGYDDSLPEYESAGLLDEKYHVTEQKHLVADHAFKEAGVQHYVRKDDSVASLSLAYKVDKSFIRKANHIFQDNLLQGRSFIVIPGAMKSLSAAPGADEERKVKLKKFMVAVKCTDYDMATSESDTLQSLLRR